MIRIRTATRIFHHRSSSSPSPPPGCPITTGGRPGWPTTTPGPGRPGSHETGTVYEPSPLSEIGPVTVVPGVGVTTMSPPLPGPTLFP